MLEAIKELFKDFKFTKLSLTEGNEMIRTSWFGRHDFVPYVRIDLWRVGFRISYDPDYKAKYDIQYRDRLGREQLIWAQRFIDDVKCHEVYNENKLYKDLCHALEDKDWV